MSNKNDIDWVWVGKLIEAADSARALGFSVGTTNWGAHIYRAVEASARQLAEQPGHLLIAAERWAQLEHMWSRNATPETIASYIGRPEILDRISKIRREHEAAVQGNAA